MTNGNSSKISDYFTDNFVLGGLSIALFIIGIILAFYNLLILVLLIIVLFIGYILGYKKCTTPVGKKSSEKETKKFELSPEKEYEILLGLYSDYEKLMTDRTNIFLLAYTFLFAAFFQLSTVSSSGTFSSDQIIYLEYTLSAFGFFLAMVHLYILSDTGIKYKNVKKLLSDIEKNNNLLVTNISRKAVVSITFAYRFIPFLVMVIWFVIGIFLINGYLNVKNILPWGNTFEEFSVIIILFTAMLVMSYVLMKIIDSTYR